MKNRKLSAYAAFLIVTLFGACATLLVVHAAETYTEEAERLLVLPATRAAESR